MVILYIKDGCPYCAAVIEKAGEIGISVDLRNIEDQEVVDELIEKGGKRQVPYMVDEEHSISMYESSSIIDYLEREYGRTKKG